MKKITAIIIIVCVLIAFSTFEQVYFNRTLHIMQAQIDELFESVRETPETVNSEQNMKDAETFIAFWSQHKHYYEMLLSHTYTLEMERNASVLYIHMEQNDYLMTTTDLASLQETCKLLKEAITPHLHNIL